MTVLVGCVGQLFQGDLDVGRRAAERLLAEPPEGDVVIEDLHYGAIAVAQFLQSLAPDGLVLVGAAGRGRPPGTVTRRRVEPPPVDERAIGEAATGYVSIDLVVEVAAALGVLPRHSVSIEVEPATIDISDSLSPVVEAALPDLLRCARAEARLVPLLALADRLRTSASGRRPSGGLPPAAVRLLEALDGVERTGEWGATFRRADRLRRALSSELAAGMDRLEWALAWGILEELERLQKAEAQEMSTDRTW